MSIYVVPHQCILLHPEMMTSFHAEYSTRLCLAKPLDYESISRKLGQHFFSFSVFVFPSCFTARDLEKFFLLSLTMFRVVHLCLTRINSSDFQLSQINLKNIEDPLSGFIIKICIKLFSDKKILKTMSFWQLVYCLWRITICDETKRKKIEYGGWYAYQKISKYMWGKSVKNECWKC